MIAYALAGRAFFCQDHSIEVWIARLYTS